MSLSPYALAALRAVSGFIFFLHGAQKVLGWFGGSAQPPFSLLWTAGALELAGGLLLITGLFTRPVAFLLSGEMAVAFFLAHFRQGWNPLTNGGEPSALYAFIFLYLSAAGPGALSVDELLKARRPSAPRT